MIILFRHLFFFISVLNLVGECYGQGGTRAVWVDAFHEGFYSSNQISSFVSNVRKANCNEVFAEVRKRGDAYYESKYEAKPKEIDPKYDPLANILAQAHKIQH